MENLNRQAAKSSEPSRTAKVVLLGVRIVACNKYALSLFGTDQEDMLGRSFLDLSAEFQSDGKLSADVLADRLSEASDGLNQPFNWLCRLTSGESFSMISWAPGQNSIGPLAAGVLGPGTRGWITSTLSLPAY